MRVGRYINEVCMMFDLSVLCDVELVHVLCDDMLMTCVAIGWNAAPEGEASYGMVTRWFSNEHELDVFCEMNLSRFREAAEAYHTGEPVPDATEWN